MNTESAFNGLGVDAITGVQLMDWLSLSPEELQFPVRFARLRSVINFLKQFPEDTQRFFVNKATRGKQVDKLDHMFEYTNLLRIKADQEKQYEALEAERSALELGNEPILLREKEEQSLLLRYQLDKTREELALYEK